MTGQSTGLRVGVWIGTLLLQAAIAYLIARLMHHQTISKVTTLMGGLERYVEISRGQQPSDSNASV